MIFFLLFILPFFMNKRNETVFSHPAKRRNFHMLLALRRPQTSAKYTHGIWGLLLLFCFPGLVTEELRLDFLLPPSKMARA